LGVGVRGARGRVNEAHADEIGVARIDVTILIRIKNENRIENIQWFEKRKERKGYQGERGWPEFEVDGGVDHALRLLELLLDHVADRLRDLLPQSEKKLVNKYIIPRNRGEELGKRACVKYWRKKKAIRPPEEGNIDFKRVQNGKAPIEPINFFGVEFGDDAEELVVDRVGGLEARGAELLD